MTRDNILIGLTLFTLGMTIHLAWSMPYIDIDVDSASGEVTINHTDTETLEAVTPTPRRNLLRVSLRAIFREPTRSLSPSWLNTMRPCGRSWGII